MKHSLVGAAALLKYSRDSASVVDPCVVFERVYPWKFDSAFRPAAGIGGAPC
jgi:hypothetical protein